MEIISPATHCFKFVYVDAHLLILDTSVKPSESQMYTKFRMSFWIFAGYSVRAFVPLREHDESPGALHCLCGVFVKMRRVSSIRLLRYAKSVIASSFFTFES